MGAEGCLAAGHKAVRAGGGRERGLERASSEVAAVADDVGRVGAGAVLRAPHGIRAPWQAARRGHARRAAAPHPHAGPCCQCREWLACYCVDKTGGVGTWMTNMAGCCFLSTRLWQCTDPCTPPGRPSLTLLQLCTACGHMWGALLRGQAIGRARARERVPAGDV